MNEYEKLAHQEEEMLRERNSLALKHNKIARPYTSTFYRKEDQALVKKIKEINYALMPIQKRMGELRRQGLHATKKDQARIFVEVAKEQLPEDVFYRILQITEGRMAEKITLTL